jgi:hypothetical protein
VCVYGRAARPLDSQAEINIRKGKKLAVFELSFKAEWEVTNDAGETASGQAEVAELFQDDVDDDFEVSALHWAERSRTTCCEERRSLWWRKRTLWGQQRAVWCEEVCAPQSAA